MPFSLHSKNFGNNCKIFVNCKGYIGQTLEAIKPRLQASRVTLAVKVQPSAAHASALKINVS